MVDMAALGAAVGVSAVIGGAVLYVIRSEVGTRISEMKGEVTRVDGRINTHEAGCEVRQRALAETLIEIKAQGHRLEDKIDRMVGSL